MKYPIIFGSAAAQHSGYYPSWRTEPAKDIDMWATYAQATEIAQIVQGELIDIGNGKAVIIRSIAQLPAFDIEILPQEEIDQIATLCGEPQLYNAGNADLHLFVAPLDVSYAILDQSAGVVQRSNEKTFRDLFFYQDLFKGQLTQTHYDIARKYRDRLISHTRFVLERKYMTKNVNEAHAAVIEDEVNQLLYLRTLAQPFLEQWREHAVHPEGGAPTAARNYLNRSQAVLNTLLNRDLDTTILQYGVNPLANT